MRTYCLNNRRIFQFRVLHKRRFRRDQTAFFAQCYLDFIICKIKPHEVLGHFHLFFGGILVNSRRSFTVITVISIRCVFRRYGDLKVSILQIRIVCLQIVYEMPPDKSHCALSLIEALLTVGTEIFISHMIFLIQIDQESHRFFHAFPVNLSPGAFCVKEICAELIVQSQSHGVEILVIIKSGPDHLSILVELCQFLGHLDKFIPGSGNIFFRKPFLFPDFFVVIHHTRRQPVICVINISVFYMGGRRRIICDQFICINVKRSHIIQDQIFIAVMYVK